MPIAADSTLSDDAIRWCAEKGLGDVAKGDVCDLPFGDAEFDLVLATDIIEHVDDDLRAVGEIRRVLAPGGIADHQRSGVSIAVGIAGRRRPPQAAISEAPIC